MKFWILLFGIQLFFYTALVRNYEAISRDGISGTFFLFGAFFSMLLPFISLMQNCGWLGDLSQSRADKFWAKANIALGLLLFAITIGHEIWLSISYAM